MKLELEPIIHSKPARKQESEYTANQQLAKTVNPLLADNVRARAVAASCSIQIAYKPL